MIQVVLLRQHLEAALRRLVENPETAVEAPAGINRGPTLTELIGLAPAPGHHLNSAPQGHARLLLALGPARAGAAANGILRPLLDFYPPHLRPVATVMFAGAGTLSGTMQVGERAESLRILKVVGSGMHRIWSAAGRAEVAPRALQISEHERWSRAIGALGLETWLRLRELHYAIVGVGRTGSLLATSLARLGVRALTLIDPDRLEIHNVDAMDGVTAVDVGRAKVDALRDSLVAVAASPERLTALAVSITSVRALVAVKTADVLVASVDSDAARLSCATIAALYAKPLLDIGTGVHGVGNGRRLGADVRLVVPGDRCLLCLGGLAHLDEARTVLDAASAVARPWHQQRVGSLRSLNQIAAHLGLRLLEDFVGERLDRSVWLRLEFDHQGLPRQEILSPRGRACALCAQVGLGDDVLAAEHTSSW